MIGMIRIGTGTEIIGIGFLAIRMNGTIQTEMVGETIEIYSRKIHPSGTIPIQMVSEITTICSRRTPLHQ